jgi:hypothetical protein
MTPKGKAKKPTLNRKAVRWAILWRSNNRVDGKREHLRGDGTGLPLMFTTRAHCRAYIRGVFGYIQSRPDLRAEPHGWKMPQAVKVLVSIEYHWRRV